MRVGIEKVDLYAGRWALEIADLVQARRGDADYVKNRIMSDSRSVYPAYEDAVTLAVNAAKRVLSPADLADIELLVVGTESAVDFGKPISTWVHRLCELSPNCRNFEVKHACYGGTAALKTAATWVASQVRPGKKALVISTDLSRSPQSGELRLQHVTADHSPEFILGGCAVAAIVGEEPAVLELELGREGYWTREIADTFRPTSTAEEADQLESLYSYLDALDGAFEHFEQLAGPIDYDALFKKHIYHVPFPGMALQAHASMMGRFGKSKADAQASFERKVAQSLPFARRIGTSYGASTFVCLLGLLETADDLDAGDCISLFSYGSGCQGEFYSARIGPEARQRVRKANVRGHLDERVRITVEQYDANEQLRSALVDRRDALPDRTALGDLYERAYAGRRLLVLKEVKSFRREYEWS
ncbi:hydroxymethylglutaryl-CoA synthase family protein [Chondromyces crocatus]|uniref:3-hydroxy-3-methylglutaryl-ACP synthase n=1 Tax=Chondromyces crocatus TaxID=52 RepID=G4RJC8_CHOCO|nr:hydroxymethylglutaryl-CoA synthase [Chondromyces crocatus]AIR74914.1 hydroxymethylglutaryl-coenzyme A synthase-like protein [Chondromyces crocatus]AKT38858.1 3-hydroxy-3-methylglutaryl-ACP synthase [Chondromyces crocatus]CBD77739.1 hydroxymethylglutaryl-coenzyme A [Chondromyces crocatus]